MLKSRIVLLGVVLFVLGAVLHLGLLDYARKPFIFGDCGDGFFNMWVMNQTAGHLARGDLNIFDGRIFWPDNGNTLLWSDTLLVPMPAFALFKALTGGIMPAFWLAAMLLVAMGFAAYFFLFFVLFRVARDRYPELPGWTAVFVPVFAYLATFSASRITTLEHFQNLSCLWLFVLLGSATGYWYYRRRIFFSIMVLSLPILLYSAPYYAVLGICFACTWGLFQLFAAPRDIPRMVRDNWLVLAVSAALFGLLAIAYAGVEPMEYTQDYVCSLSMKLFHPFTPCCGLGKRLFERTFCELPHVSHEIPAYLGPGLILSLLAIGVWKIPALGAWLRKSARSPLFWMLVVLAAVYSEGRRDWQDFTCWLGIGVILVVLALYARGMARRTRENPIVFAFAFLALAAVICYGLADGPLGDFTDQPVNPSIWGVSALVVPGVRNMRAIGRLAAIGQGVVFAIVLLALFRLYAATGRNRMKQVALTLSAVFLTGLQFADQLQVHAAAHSYDPAHVTPTIEEKEFFSGIEGPAAVFPANPFYQNTYAMLYFSEFGNISIMNGYSARSTALWDHIMKLGRDGHEPTEAQIACAATSGCKYLVMQKWRTRGSRLAKLKNSARAVLFENNRFIVLAAARSQPVAAGP